MAIPFGPWRPDSAAVNSRAMVNVRGVLPDSNGFRPFPQLAAVTDALNADPVGAAVPLSSTGAGVPFAGTAVALFKLQADGRTWEDVTRASGGAYSVPAGQRWRFTEFAGLVIAANSDDAVQKFTLASSTDFEALGGSPPVGTYIAVVAGSFVVLANIVGATNRVDWSGLGNAEQWTPGTNSSGQQPLNFGGPIQGLVGGEVGYVFQRSQITRMLFAPGSPEIFQFDVVESERGLLAPNTLVQVGDVVFFLNKDGFYRLNTETGQAAPIGAEKADRFFLSDYRAGTELSIKGAADPVNRLVLWSYISRDNSGSVPDRCIVYDWSIGEWSLVDVALLEFVEFISQTVSLDNLDPFGNMETLPFSLDSPFWEGGSTILGVFGTDRKVSHFTGLNQAATLETSDAELTPGRATYVGGAAPIIDTNDATVAVAARDRLGDALSFSDAEAMEDTGVCPAHAEGRYLRARVEVPAGAAWTRAQGIDPVAVGAGEQ